MENRIVDAKRRIYLPEEVRPCFYNEFAFFRYHEQERKVHAISARQLSLIKLGIELEYGMPSGASRNKTWYLFKDIAKLLCMSPKPCSNRVKVPDRVMQEAGIDTGDKVEIEVFGGNQFKFNKAG